MLGKLTGILSHYKAVLFICCLFPNWMQQACRSTLFYQLLTAMNWRAKTISPQIVDIILHVIVTYVI